MLQPLIIHRFAYPNRVHLNLFRIHELLSGHVVQVIGRNLCISSQFIEETTCRYVIANTATFY
jgi:hypothetical protein